MESSTERTSRLDAPPAQPPHIEGYQILRLIGSGGQGDVWLALRLATGEKVAIKTIAQGAVRDPEARARFELVHLILQRLDHPGIVRALDRGELASGELWHATEYVAGRCIDEHVRHLDDEAVAARRKRGRVPFPLREVVELFIKVCAAVEAAHRQGVLHRDLKPANILIDEQGEPRIVDFGIARADVFWSSAEARRPAAAYTLTGRSLGTPAYAAPEQAEGRWSLVDARADVYSLGVVLYELLTGRSPYGVEDRRDVTREAIATRDPIPARGIARYIHRDVEAILLKALRKKPDERYQSVAELRADLAAFLEGRAVVARGGRMGYLVGTFVRRRKVAVSSAAAFFIALIVGLPVILTLLFRAREAREQSRTFAMRLRENAALVTAFDDALGELPGGDDVRRVVLPIAIQNLDLITPALEQPEELQQIRAALLTAIGDMALRVGDRAVCEAMRRESLDIWRSLALTARDNREYQVEHSLALVRMGDLRRGEQDLKGAMSYYEPALRIDEALVWADPHDLHYIDNLSWSYERVGELLWHAGHEDASLTFAVRRLQLARYLVSREPNNPVRMRGLSLGTWTMLRYDHLGATAEAIDPFVQSAALAVKLDPNNRAHIFTAVAALCLRARFLIDLCGYTPAAEADYHAAVALYAGLMKHEPESVDTLSLRQDILFASAYIAVARGDPGPAVADLEEVVELLERRVIYSDPNDGTPAIDLVRAAEAMIEVLDWPETPDDVCPSARRTAERVLDDYASLRSESLRHVARIIRKQRDNRLSAAPACGMPPERCFVAGPFGGAE